MQRDAMQCNTLTTDERQAERTRNMGEWEIGKYNLIEHKITKSHSNKHIKYAQP